ncbi:MAG TPA: Nramp family divalent metal transporter, partial [Ktedonobacterales bacterium]|nr:Nramp family divalent metal transporter [Ktedonobacterales bacterium]
MALIADAMDGKRGAQEVAAGDRRTVAAARATLAGKGRGIWRVLPFLGPAFIASVAYIDPGNFATNIQGGSAFGYQLLWVILASNLMAVLLQTLSAKLGIATGMNLPEVCAKHLPRRANIGLWLVAELAAMATDLAEFIGASLGFYLLLHIPLFLAGLLTGVVTFLLLGMRRYGFRPLEAIIFVLIVVIAGSYLIEVVLARPDAGQIALHSVTPMLSGNSALLAVGILGATVMPHVVYLHSALTQQRIVPGNDHEARRVFRFEQLDIWIAMGLAGLVNGAMLIMAASVFFGHGLTGVATLEDAHQTLIPLLG